MLLARANELPVRFTKKEEVMSDPIKKAMLVHGGFVDGSGWRPVYDLLTSDGYAEPSWPTAGPLRSMSS
jgi:hypothetical protein